MTALHVVAHVPGAVCMPSQPVAIDALLMAAAALRDGLPPADVQAAEIAIPVRQERGIYLATTAVLGWEEHDRHWINRRFPIEEAQALAEPKFRRVQLSTGPTKSYRIPLEVGYLRESKVEWWCDGEAEEIRALLALVTHIGKKRSVGNGEVRSWSVEECATWDGFPLVRDGKPMRPLPLDWPGVTDADRAYRVLTPPYWQRWREEVCLVPPC